MQSSRTRTAARGRRSKHGLKARTDSGQTQHATGGAARRRGGGGPRRANTQDPQNRPTLDTRPADTQDTGDAPTQDTPPPRRCQATNRDSWANPAWEHETRPPLPTTRPRRTRCRRAAARTPTGTPEPPELGGTTPTATTPRTAPAPTAAAARPPRGHPRRRRSWGHARMHASTQPSGGSRRLGHVYMGGCLSSCDDPGSP